MNSISFPLISSQAHQSTLKLIIELKINPFHWKAMGSLGLVALSFIVLHLGLNVTASQQGPVRQTPKGRLRGVYETSRNGLQYESFLGIRYAHVSRRFDVSVPTGSWDGVRDAVAHGPHCAQQSLVGSPATGEEDCLYLNVFTPKADNEKRAVMVYIHGGGFNMGAGTEYGGDFLVDEDIVLVTLNYRLGILGFLNTPRGPVAGNMGLKDQLEALKWVQNNIEHFGGDKTRVTLAGNSAGGAAVIHLLTAPSAQGLFHRIFAISGTAFSPFGYKESVLEDAREIGEHLNCKGLDQTDLVNCLSDEPLETLLLAQKSIPKWNLDLFRLTASREVKGPKNPEPFLDETPEDRLRRGNFTKIPVLMTMTKDEGGLSFSALVIRNEDLLKSLNNDYKKVAPITFMLTEEFGKKAKDVAKAMKGFYFDNKAIVPDMEEKLTEAYTDTWYFRGIARTAHILATHTNVYTGLFTHARQDFSPVQLFGIEEDIEGVVHTEDLSYIFNPTGVANPIPHLSALKEDKDIQFSKKYVKVLASFFKEGVPTVSFSDETWTPVSQGEVDSKSLNFFELNDTPSIRINPFKERLDFWGKIVQKTTKPKETRKDKTEL